MTRSLSFVSGKFSALRIRTKIFLAFIAVIFSSILLVSTVLMNTSKRIIETNAREFSRELVRQAAAIADWRAKDFEKFAFATTDDSTLKKKLRDFDASAKSERQVFAHNLIDGVNRQAALDQFIRSFAILSPSGKLFSWDKKNNVFHPDAVPSEIYPDLGGLYRSLKAAGEKTVWIGAGGDGGKVIFARRIIDSESFDDLGLFAAEIDAAYFDLAMQEDSPLREGTLIIADEAGRLLFSNGKGRTSSEGIAKAFSQASNAEVFVSEDESVMTFAIETMVKRWKVICVLPLAYLLRHEGSTRLAVILVSVAALLFAVVLSLGLSSGITKNIKALERSMRTIEKGDFNIRIEPHSLDEVGLLGLRFNIMANKIDELINTVYRERLAKKELEFKALQAQINPHFLYNTLGSIKWLAKKDGQDSVETMISTLIKLLRFSVSASEFTTLEEELRYVSNYLVLQKLRYEDRFSFEFRSDESASGLRVLRFVLQPLVENALYHGIELSKGSGLIRIGAERRPDALLLTVEDNGIGFDEKEIERLLAEPKKEYPGLNSIGIKNVNDRIKLHFGEEFGLVFSARTGGGTVVKVRLPILSGDEEGMCTSS